MKAAVISSETYLFIKLIDVGTKHLSLKTDSGLTAVIDIYHGASVYYNDTVRFDGTGVFILNSYDCVPGSFSREKIKILHLLQELLETLNENL